MEAVNDGRRACRFVLDRNRTLFLFLEFSAEKRKDVLSSRVFVGISVGEGSMVTLGSGGVSLGGGLVVESAMVGLCKFVSCAGSLGELPPRCRDFENPRKNILPFREICLIQFSI